MNWTNLSADERRQAARDWLAALSGALARRDYRRVAGMMHGDGYWRDLLTFGWEFRTLHGIEAVRAWLPGAFDRHCISDVRLDGDCAIGSMLEYRPTLEFFFRFETEMAHGRGYARLLAEPDAPDGPKALTLLTAMQEWKLFPQSNARSRPREDLSLAARQADNWLDRRNAARQYREHDPQVIVIGGGQAGLMVAARLRQLDIDALVVEKTARIGDVWRNRYHSLHLHNETCMNHFAYLPFPEHWPAFIPKDKLADWLEFYAEAMEVNVWTGTLCLGGGYDEGAGCWNVRLRLADGSVRTMRPSHVVIALGVSGIPSIPELVGAREFGGPIVHSNSDTDALAVDGKSVLVVGAGNSAHDVAQQMHWRGAKVAMLQRSSVTIVSLESSVRPYQLYRDNDGVRPIEDTDLIAASVPYPLLARLHRPLSKRMAEEDKDLLDGLRKVGFLLDNGEDDTGYFLKLLRYQAGYYLNIGASDLIVEGKIKLKAGVDIARLRPSEVVFSDGTSLHADIIVLATGYQPLQEGVRALFGDEVADRVGPIWGIGADGELCAMYARTGQPGLYVSGGGLPGARAYSHYTALLIKAEIEGLLVDRRSASGGARPPERRAEPAAAATPY